MSLLPFSKHLARLRIVLASASPRRKRVLAQMLGQGVEFEVVSSSFDENLSHAEFSSPDAYAVENSFRKALDVWSTCRPDDDAVVIGADTVVVLDNEILEKPASAGDAVEMLTRLSERKRHRVVTGVSLLSAAGDCEPRRCSFSVSTTVNFCATEQAIRAYVKTGEPLDKAGAYGIQDGALTFVEGVEGDYFNVVGMPSFEFARQFTDFVPLVADDDAATTAESYQDKNSQTC